ncbi:MAG: hypothetical protein KatS3mg102_2014 [Planctomycetota bacterium]|nr:MAG: hypothetical protein KatS3mg102_2014 [Planctomycetota bacterium]
MAAPLDRAGGGRPAGLRPNEEAGDRAGTTAHELRGLAPDNLLAFLALLGLLRALEAARSDWQPRVCWQGPPWRAWLHLAQPAEQAEIAAATREGLERLAAPVSFDGRKNITDFSPAEFREFCVQALSAADPELLRQRAALLAALASDACTSPREPDRLDTTLLCAAFGQGHQHFLERLERLAEAKPPAGVVQAGKRRRRRQSPAAADEPPRSGDRLRGWWEDRLLRALFSPWTYEDNAKLWPVSLRWDPAENRQYALRFGDPSPEPIMTMFGAQRLAACAVPVLPTAPAKAGLQTTGFLVRKGQAAMSWPLWSPQLSLVAISALLRHPDLVSETAPRERLAAYGVVEVMRARRVRVGRQIHFELARPLWGLQAALSGDGT